MNKIKYKLLHLGLELGVPLLVTLHPLDLIREKLMSQTADWGKTDVTNNGLRDDYCHNEWIRERLLSQPQ